MQVPAGVQAGDTLVLFMTTNSLSGTLGSPAGWTLLQSKDGTATRGRAWTKQATAGDAGATSRSPSPERRHQGRDERRAPTAAPAAPPR